MIGKKMSELLLDSATLKFYQWEGDVQEHLDNVRKVCAVCMFVCVNDCAICSYSLSDLRCEMCRSTCTRAQGVCVCLCVNDCAYVI